MSHQHSPKGQACRRQRGTRLLVTLSAVTAAVVLGLGVAPAGAVPQRGETLILDCDVLGSVTILTNTGNGLWTPGFVAGSNRRLIPYAFRFEFTPAGGATEVEEFSKPAPRNGRLDRCEFGESGPEGSFTGVVWVSYTPAR